MVAIVSGSPMPTLMSWADVRDLCDRLGIPYEEVKRSTIQETLQAIEEYRRRRGW
jgi:hypothetical protein